MLLPQDRGRRHICRDARPRQAYFPNLLSKSACCLLGIRYLPAIALQQKSITWILNHLQNTPTELLGRRWWQLIWWQSHRIWRYTTHTFLKPEFSAFSKTMVLCVPGSKPWTIITCMCNMWANNKRSGNVVHQNLPKRQKTKTRTIILNILSENLCSTTSRKKLISIAPNQAT